MTNKAYLCLLSLWLGATAIIDFAVVPTVFATIHDFFNAGELGMRLFSKFNLIELIISSALIILGLLKFKRSEINRLNLIFLLSSFFIVILYLSYLTPKISHLTELWKQADAINSVGISEIADIQQEHQRYHRYYVTIDSLKLLILSFLLGSAFLRKEKIA